MMETVTKPPLGVMPRRDWLSARYVDLGNAIRRYAASGHRISPDWVLEVVDIEEQLKCEEPNGVNEKIDELFRRVATLEARGEPGMHLGLCSMYPAGEPPKIKVCSTCWRWAEAPESPEGYCPHVGGGLPADAPACPCYNLEKPEVATCPICSQWTHQD